MDLSVQNVFGLIIRSKLLSADEARAMFDRWQADAKDKADNVAEFARWMVANQYLTEYQATLLARGHADCFFLNQYKILDRLGKGRMAGVYRAVHRLGQTVAIKVLPPSKAKDPHLLARFQREARLAMKLKHPNVVRTFQVGSTSGLYYLVMECLEGETLDEVIQRRKKLPIAEAVRIAHQALLGLQHLHEQGMVHRDLKPSNLMVVPAGVGQESTLRATVKILDLSLSKALSDESDDGTEGEPQLTTEGTLLGTPDYMAPEQARDAHAADIRADIYAIGCVLFHLVAGQTPFPDSNIISQMIRHATEQPKPLKEFNPAVPDGLQQILNWMLAKDPNKRYPTPERAALALQVFLAAGSEQSNNSDDPKLKTYLNWLESEHDIAPPAAPVAPARPASPPAKPAAVTPTATKPVAAPVVAANASAPANSKPSRDKKREKKHKRQHSPAQAAGSPPPTVAATKPVASPAAGGEFDVELLPATPKAKPRQGMAALVPALSQRDFVMLGIGAGSVVFVGVIGMILAKIFG
jgi:serine/threonine protein kinase